MHINVVDFTCLWLCCQGNTKFTNRKWRFLEGNFKLEYEVKDATRNPIKATTVTLDFLCKKEVAAFIGPEGPSCSTVATMAAAENKAMISYG